MDMARFRTLRWHLSLVVLGCCAAARLRTAPPGDRVERRSNAWRIHPESTKSGIDRRIGEICISVLDASHVLSLYGKVRKLT